MAATTKTTANKRKTKSAKAQSARKTVLVLRTCKNDMSSFGGFVWPESGEVAAPDWSPTATCGHGLHGWLWGLGNWRLKLADKDLWWLVVEVAEADLIDLGDKVKFPRGTVLARYRHWYEAMAVIRQRLIDQVDLEPIATQEKEHAFATGDYGHASATGYYGHASATGYRGHASALGDHGNASATGYCGHAFAAGEGGYASAVGKGGHAFTAGDCGRASTTNDCGHAAAFGDCGYASALGNCGHASALGDAGHAFAAGDYGHALATGYYGRASAAGKDGHASALGKGGYASATGKGGCASVLGKDGHASALGKNGWAVAGYGGRARAAKNGVLTLLWWDAASKRPRAIVGYVGENGIEAETWYWVRNGKIEKCPVQN